MGKDIREVVPAFLEGPGHFRRLLSSLLALATDIPKSNPVPMSIINWLHTLPAYEPSMLQC